MVFESATENDYFNSKPGYVVSQTNGYVASLKLTF